MTRGTLRWAVAGGAVLAAAVLLGAAPAHAASGDTAGGSLSGAPATLLVGTVPAIPGVRVGFDGHTFLTGPHGKLKIATVSGRHHISILPPRSEPANTGVRFSRWIDGLALTSRAITLSPGSNREQAGFVVAHPIAVRFIDPGGRPVPLSHVTRLTVGSSLGERYTFAPASPPSALPANRIVRGQSGLVPLAIRYSLREVLIGGSNVVYGGSQNFFVHPSGTWTVQVLLFSLRVKVRDAFFGFGTGGAVRLTLPDGSSRTVSLGPDHEVTVNLLPRGTYQLVAKGSGLGLSSPSTLSKPQVAKLLLFSWLDMFAVLAFAVLFVLGLPVLSGRIVRGTRGIRLPIWHAGRAWQHPHPAAGGKNPERTSGRPAGPAADGLAADGLAADGLEADGLAADGLAADGLEADGLAADDLAADGLEADGLEADDLAVDDPATDSDPGDQPGTVGAPADEPGAGQVVTSVGGTP